MEDQVDSLFPILHGSQVRNVVGKERRDRDDRLLTPGIPTRPLARSPVRSVGTQRQCAASVRSVSARTASERPPCAVAGPVSCRPQFDHDRQFGSRRRDFRDRSAQGSWSPLHWRPRPPRCRRGSHAPVARFPWNGRAGLPARPNRQGCLDYSRSAPAPRGTSNLGRRTWNAKVRSAWPGDEVSKPEGLLPNSSQPHISLSSREA